MGVDSEKNISPIRRVLFQTGRSVDTIYRLVIYIHAMCFEMEIIV